MENSEQAQAQVQAVVDTVLKVKPKRKITKPRKPRQVLPKKADFAASVVIQNPPSLLLQSVYFLSPHKYLAIGYSVEHDCRPIILINSLSRQLPTSYIELDWNDWFVLSRAKFAIQNWFTIGQPFPGGEPINSNKFSISTFYIPRGGRLIMLENKQSNRENCVVFLDEADFKKCVEADCFFFGIIGQLQSNWQQVGDYLNNYVFRCIISGRSFLPEDEYFQSTNIQSNLDTYRLYQEIPFLCQDRIQSELAALQIPFATNEQSTSTATTTNM